MLPENLGSGCGSLRRLMMSCLDFEVSLLFLARGRRCRPGF